MTTKGQLTFVAGVLAKLSRRMMGWNCMVLKYFRWIRAVRRTFRGNGRGHKRVGIVANGKMLKPGFIWALS